MVFRVFFLFFFVFQVIISGYSTFTIEAEYFPLENHIKGTQHVQFTNDSLVPLNRLYFVVDNLLTEPNPTLSKVVNDLGYINGFSSSPITIDLVLGLKGDSYAFQFEDELKYIKTKKYAHSNNMFYVQLKETLQPGESIQLTIQFTTHIPKRYIMGERLTLNDTTTLRFAWYPVEFMFDDQGWILDKLAFRKHVVDRLTVTVPKRYDVGIVGDKVTVELIGDKKRVESVGSTARISSSLIISPTLNRLSSKTQVGIAVELFYLDQDKHREAQFILDQSVDIIEYYVKKLGAPSFKRLVIANSPVMGDWGMASDAFIFLGDGAIGSAQISVQKYMNRVLGFLMAHEIAHLWAGVGNPIDFNTDNYLSEGLANYICFDYFEHRYGVVGNMFASDSGLIGHLILNCNYLTFRSFLYRHQNKYRLTKKNRWHEPLSLSNHHSYLHNKLTKDYSIGYLTFRQLAHYMGEDSFLKGLQYYFSLDQNVYSIDDFERSMQRYSDRDLSLFFNDWFKGHPHLDVSVDSVTTTKQGDEFLHQVTLNKEGDSSTDLDISLVYEDKTIMKRLKNLKLKSTFSARSNTPLKNIVLDPEGHLLDHNRQNNQLHRSIDFYYFGNSEMLLNRKPLDHYFLGVTPFLSNDSLYGEGDLLGPGVKVFGTDNQSHFWKFGWARKYHELSSNTTSSLFAGYSFLLPQFRYLNISSTYDEDGQLDSGISYVHPWYSVVDIGLYGEYKLPEHTLIYSLKRYHYVSNQRAHSFKLTWQYQNLNTLYKHATSFEIAPDISINDIYYEKFLFYSQRVFSLRPRVLLVPQTTLGYGRHLPEAFDSGNLRGQFLEQSREGQKSYKQSVDLIFPLQYGKKDQVMKMLIYRGMAVAGFVEIGNTFTDDDIFDEGLLIGGVEMNCLFTSIADRKFAFSLGYATTLAHSDVYSSSGAVYFSFRTPLSLYAHFYGY